LAAEYASVGIRFNCIAPSLTDTPLAQRLLNTDDKKEASKKRHPLGRYGTADELAEAASFLIQPSSSWITGQILHIDGGMSALRTL
jgi:NAD(P)-dependent dehydrogenase (short-subunit alcohol dehydrogenase family)